MTFKESPCCCASWAFPAFGKVQADSQTLHLATDACFCGKCGKSTRKSHSGVMGGCQSPPCPQDKGNGSWALMSSRFSLAQPASGQKLPVSQRQKKKIPGLEVSPGDGEWLWWSQRGGEWPYFTVNLQGVSPACESWCGHAMGAVDLLCEFPKSKSEQNHPKPEQKCFSLTRVLASRAGRHLAVQVSSLKRLEHHWGHWWRHCSSVRVVTSQAVGSLCYKALGKFNLISHSISPTTGMKLLKKIYIEHLQWSVQTLQKMQQI